MSGFAITEGYINNRNMHAPFLIGYGMLILAIYFVLGTPDKVILFRKYEKKTTKVKSYLLYFALAFVVVCVAEIILGTIVEKVCHINYWNYSWLPLHITKYTSVHQLFVCVTHNLFYGCDFSAFNDTYIKNQSQGHEGVKYRVSGRYVS